MARCLFPNHLIVHILFGLVLIDEISTYEKIFVENSKLCAYREHDDPTVVKLGKDEPKLVVHGHYFDRWSGKYSFSCDFFVKAPSKYGIYAVVQYLNFRKDSSTGSCKDYVKIEVPQKFFNFSPKTVKTFCGKLLPRSSVINLSRELDYLEAFNNSVLADNGFVTREDFILVKIHVAREKLKPDEKLDIEIAFTAYKHECTKESKKKEKLFTCRECEWIPEKLVMDKVQNCPYSSCLDENYCRNIGVRNEIPNVLVSSGTGTKVSIGAVTTIILVLLTFGCCVWISRRMKLWCFNPTRNRQPRMEMNTTERVPGFDEVNNRYGDIFPETLAPSAPPIPDEKDLPPSYSSLFPEK